MRKTRDLFKKIRVTKGNLHALLAQLVKNIPAEWGPRLDPFIWKILKRREWQLTLEFWSGEFQGNLLGYNQ